jgi:hypothetical protein
VWICIGVRSTKAFARNAPGQRDAADHWSVIASLATLTYDPIFAGEFMMKRATDTIHMGLMVAALAITYVVPFELLLLSYVVLGPAR